MVWNSNLTYFILKPDYHNISETAWGKVTWHSKRVLDTLNFIGIKKFNKERAKPELEVVDGNLKDAFLINVWYFLSSTEPYFLVPVCGKWKYEQYRDRWFTGAFQRPLRLPCITQDGLCLVPGRMLWLWKSVAMVQTVEKSPSLSWWRWQVECGWSIITLCLLVSTDHLCRQYL